MKGSSHKRNRLTSPLTLIKAYLLLILKALTLQCFLPSYHNQLTDSYYVSLKGIISGLGIISISEGSLISKMLCHAPDTR